MAEINNKPTLDDWDIMAGSISQSLGGDNVPDIDPDDLIELVKPTDPVEPVDPVDPEEDPVEPKKDPIVDDKQIKFTDPLLDADPDPADPADPVDPDPVDPDELAEYESDITKVFQDKLAEELNWEFKDDEKFESVKEMVDYMKIVIQDASAPVFASDEMEELNTFVNQGGKLRDFYDKTVEVNVDVDNMDLEKESHQKAAVRQELSIRGFKEDRIDRTIDRYVDAGVLEEEAGDSVEFLKDYKTKTKQKLLEDQENSDKYARQEQQKFVSNVQETVKSIEDIRGIKISSKDKQDLLEYIFKPDSEGLTQYQRDYKTDVKNLIESAYFTKQGDTMIAKAKKQGSSDANRDLMNKMKASKAKRQKGSGSQGDLTSKSDTWDLLGKSLL